MATKRTKKNPRKVEVEDERSKARIRVEKKKEVTIAADKKLVENASVFTVVRDPTEMLRANFANVQNIGIKEEEEVK